MSTATSSVKFENTISHIYIRLFSRLQRRRWKNVIFHDTINTIQQSLNQVNSENVLFFRFIDRFLFIYLCIFIFLGN